MLERRQWTHQEGSSGIRDGDIKEQLYLRKERTTVNGIRGWSSKQLRLESMGNVNETFREILRLQITMRIEGTFIRLWKMSVRTFVDGLTPLK
jgi:hypothetical protein